MEIKLINAFKDYKFPLKAAAYCRVSTKSEEQTGSLENQIKAYTDFIQNNPLLKFEGVFSDTATGRNSKREGFQKLIAKCKRRKIDLIIAKSISRFGRNTLDTIRTIRLLADLNIDVYFEKENLHSLDTDNRTALELYAAFAQEESESKSKNIKWGIEQRFKSGSSSYTNRKCYGFNKGKDGHLEINNDEAIVVLKIFEMYLNGRSLGEISTELENNSVTAPNGGIKWSRQTISNILGNEKYIGNVLLQKTYVENFLKAKQKRNNGEKPQYYVENAHEALLSSDIFEAARKEKIARSLLKKQDTSERRPRKGSSLSGNIICGCCGHTYRRITRSDGVVVWRCGNRVDNGKEACPESRTVKENEIINQIRCCEKYKYIKVLPTALKIEK